MGDVDDLARLVHAAYRDPTTSGWTSEADLLGGQRIDSAMLGELVEATDTTVLVAELDGGVIGSGALTMPAAGVTATFGLFAVAPHQQGQGIGTQLLESAEQRAATAGFETIELTVIDVRTEVIAWYRKRGYTPTGETRPFPYGDERFGVPKRQDLRFTVLVKPVGPGGHEPAH